MPVLTLLIFLPFAGALAQLVVPGDRRQPSWLVSLAFTGAALALSLVALAQYAPGTDGFTLRETAPWIPSWGVYYKLGVDGLSLLLIVLTNLLTFLCVVFSRDSITQRHRAYYFFLLLLQAGVIGTFSALDLVLFYVFWEVMLVPLYFLIGMYGSGNRVYAALKFFLFTLVGSMLMLVGFLWLYFHCGTFDVLEIPQRLRQAPLPLDHQLWLFGALFIAFAIKVPMWPLHTWLPDAHTEAPTAGSVILAGVLLKTGVYGMVRFCLPFFPEAALVVRPLVLWLSVVAIIYGAGAVIGLIVGPRERADIKRMIAYSSVSHMGFITLGLFAFTAAGVQGGLLQMLNHGLSTSALFLLVGVLYDRRHTRLMHEYGGVASAMPVYATLFMIAMLASVGLPLLNGFVGEFLILLGTFGVSRTLAVLAATGVILGAVYLLWMYQRVFFGPLNNPANRQLPDCTWRELVALVPLLALCLWIGLHPGTCLKWLEPTSRQIVRTVGGDWEPELFSPALEHLPGGKPRSPAHH